MKEEIKQMQLCICYSQDSRKGRITEWIKEEKLWGSVGFESFNPEFDRVMICGSEDMTADIKNIFEKRGCKEGSTKEQGGFVIEKAFAEK